MKKFICFAPRQIRLGAVHYGAVDNQRLYYPEATSFPIIPVIHGYAEKGETVQVICITEDYECSIRNAAQLQDELKTLEGTIGITCHFIEQCIPYDDSVFVQIDAFQKLIDLIEDGDCLHACITYGSKPSPVVELMALRYARQIKKNTYIECVVYGQMEHKTGKGTIYDLTALVQLDDIVRVLAARGDENPKATLDKIIHL